MCGFAAILGARSEENQGGLAGRLLSSLRHRGPDGDGIYMDKESGVLFCHTRLAVLDPTERSNQPLSDPHGRVIVFNGEIYNFRELRAGLEQEGMLFHTDSDTEVLLALYHRKGADMVNSLRGMFAFVIWDPKKKEAFAARDAFGIKPLYVAQTGMGWIMASEVRTMLATGWIRKRMSPEGIHAYFRMGSCPDEVLPFAGIQTLSPGSFGWWRQGVWHHAGQVDVFDRETTSPATVQCVRDRWLDSLRAHTVSDVPVSLFLSGGVDSVAILTGLDVLGRRDVQTFTLGWSQGGQDEAREAAEMARAFGMPHETLPVDPDQLETWFQDYLSAQDLPGIDGFNTYLISKLATQRGYKVALSGMGGDELLGGYPTFHRLPLLWRAGRMTNRVPGASRLLRSMSGARLPRQWMRVAEFLSGSATPLRAYAALRGLFTHREVMLLCERAGWADIAGLNDHVAGLRLLGDNMEGQKMVSELETRNYLAHQLLREADTFGMAHGLEIRVPFLDLPFWRQVCGLDDATRFISGKRLWKMILPEMPNAPFERPKRGFTLPWDYWQKKMLASSFKKVALPDLGYTPTWFQAMSMISWLHWTTRLELTVSGEPI